MNKIYYHYCSLNSFFGILESKSLWLNDAMKSNDRTEMKFALEILQVVLGNSKHMNIIKEFEESYLNWIGGFFQPHIACFSLNGDILSQWRAYANDGRGVAIGFSANYLKRITDKDPNKDFIIEKVVYDKENQENLMRSCISEILKSNYTDGFHIISIVSEILKCSQKIKNNEFYEEQEIRLIHGHAEVAAERDMFKFRVTNDDIISYVDIPLYYPDIKEHAIKEIIIGPKSKITEKDVENISEKYWTLFDTNFNVYKSKCSYR